MTSEASAILRTEGRLPRRGAHLVRCIRVSHDLVRYEPPACCGHMHTSTGYVYGVKALVS